MNTEQERAEFEAWCDTRSLETGRDNEDDYISLETALSWEAYQAGQAATQSQATEAFPCRIVEADFETGTVTLEMHGNKYTVSSRQKFLWDAPLQSQHDEETKNLRDALWIAERKIEALQSQDAEDVERINFIEANPGWLRVSRLGHRTKQMWACVSPFTNYEYDLFKTAREAIDHARRIEGDS